MNIFPDITGSIGEVGSASKDMMEWVNNLSTIKEIDVMAIITVLIAIALLCISLSGLWAEMTKGRMRRR